MLSRKESAALEQWNKSLEYFNNPLPENKIEEIENNYNLAVASLKYEKIATQWRRNETQIMQLKYYQADHEFRLFALDYCTTIYKNNLGLTDKQRCKLMELKLQIATTMGLNANDIIKTLSANILKNSLIQKACIDNFEKNDLPTEGITFIESLPNNEKNIFLINHKKHFQEVIKNKEDELAQQAERQKAQEDYEAKHPSLCKYHKSYNNNWPSLYTSKQTQFKPKTIPEESKTALNPVKKTKPTYQKFTNDLFNPITVGISKPTTISQDTNHSQSFKKKK